MRALPYVGVVMLVALIRGWMHFSTPLMKGVNGAYYLVQARALLERGSMAIPDFPLTFGLHAGLAKLIQWGTGWDLDESILFAVKVLDSLLPALAAIPILALLEYWRRTTTQAPRWIPIAGAIVATLGLPTMRMLGDFQKNGLAMVWLAAFLWFLHAWFQRPTGKLAACALASFGLIGITHLGVLGSAILIGVLISVLQLVQEKRGAWQRSAMWLGAMGGVLACAVVIIHQFDPERVSRLLGAISHPLSFAQGKGEPLPGMTIAEYAVFRTLTFTLLFGGMALPALIVVWRRRSTLPSSTCSVVAGCGLAVLAMIGPWGTSGDRLLRFMILAYFPACLILFFAIQFISRPKLQIACAVMAAGLWIGPMPGSLAVYGRAAIPDAAGSELRALKSLIPKPGNTLIVTGHGLEWWAAWMLETKISQGTTMEISDWENYEEVLFLTQKTDLLPMTELAVKGGGGTPESSTESAKTTIVGSYFASPPIPKQAQVLHDGTYFTLARVLSPPPYLTQ